MSGVRFITDDPVGVGYDREWDRLERQRIRDQQMATDAALRGGIQDMLSVDQAAGLANAGAYTPPTAATMQPTGARAPLAATDFQPHQAAFLQELSQPESGGRYNVIYGGQTFDPARGHPGVAVPITTGPDANSGKTSSAAGRYQFLAPTWQEAARRAGVDPADFSDAAQDRVAWSHAAETYRAKTGRDLNADLQSPDPAVRSGIHAALRGQWPSLPGGAQAPGGGGGMLTQQAQPAPRRSGLDYQPVLSRLAQTPGAGRTAMTMLGQAQRTNAAMMRRQEQYERMVGTALSQGNIAGAQYYAGLAGVELPESILRDAGQAKRAGAAIRLTQQFYRNDPEAGQRFAAAYVQTGNVDQAFAAAGPPRDNPTLQVVKVREGEQDVLYGVNRRTGTAEPITTQGQPAPANDGGWSDYAPPTQEGPRPLTSDRPPPTAGRPGAAPRPTATQQKAEIMRAAGWSDEEIASAIAGQSVKPAQVASLYRGFVSAASQSMDMLGKPDKQKAWVEQQMDAALPGWRQAQGRAGAAPGGYLPPAATEGGPGASQFGYGAGSGATMQPGGYTPPGAPSVATQSPNRPAAPAAGPISGPTATPNQAQIERLRKDPSLAPYFDQKFGAGAAARVLGGGG